MDYTSFSKEDFAALRADVSGGAIDMLNLIRLHERALEGERQVGFARVITDRATFAWRDNGNGRTVACGFDAPASFSQDIRARSVAPTFSIGCSRSLRLCAR